MATFQITTYPAKSDGRFTTIAITNRISRTTVECKLDELPAKLKEIAEATPRSTMQDMPHVHACAYAVGRAPNGFKAFEAARKNVYTNESPVPAGWASVTA